MSDVKRGNCWFCREPGDKIPCSRCKIGRYCSKKCLKKDQRRHNSECQSFGPQSCSYCNKQLENRLECSGCGEAYYCGLECQRKHWKQPDKLKAHKRVCNGYKNIIRYNAALWQNKIQRYQDSKHHGEMPCYFGTDFAVDYLALKDNEWQMPYESDDPCLVKDYSILSAGCGDIRSLIFTVASLPEEFTGNIHFTMCDFDPFVMARNVLFLYMMIHHADRSDIDKTVTTLWYSVQLSQEDHDFLKEVLCVLCNVSDGSLKQLTGGIVDMPNDQLTALKRVWKRWGAIECDRAKPGHVSLHKQRRKVRDNIDAHLHYRDDFHEEQMESYKKWKFDGIFTESIMEVEQLPCYNPTLTGFKGCDQFAEGALRPEPDELKKPLDVEKMKYEYCVISKSDPFYVWDFEVVKKFGRDSSITTMYHAYISHAIKKVIAFMGAPHRISITMTTQDFQELKQEAVYDRVFTSTLVDYYGVQPVVKFFGPFLKRENQHAVIAVGTFSLKNDAADYLFNQFELDWRDSECIGVSMGELMDPSWPLEWDTHCLDYHYDSMWFMRFLKSAHLATTAGSDENLVLSKAKVPSCKAVIKCGELQMRDIRTELNKVVPYRYTWAVREGAQPVKGLRYMEWYYPSS